MTRALKLSGYLSVLVVAALAACAGGPSRPAEPAGLPPEAVAADAAQAHLKGLRGDLEDIVVSGIGMRGLDIALKDGALSFDVPAFGTFEADNAQLRLDALKPWASVAEEMARWGAVVVQVRALARADAESQSLAERRAASLAEFLIARGLPAGRVRHEHLVDVARAQRLELVLRVVVIGREREAWMPPEIKP